MSSLRKIIALIGIILFFGLGFFLGKGKKRPAEIIVQKDTVTVIDTQYIDKPVPKYITVIRKDTLRTEYWHLQHDTVIAEIPIEQKVYEQDSLYRAVISGWHANLDSIWIYKTTTEITITKKTPAPKFSFGITAGPSALVTPSGSIKAGLGITAGLQYRF